MRLYESTGVGTFLLTDWKQNLGDILEPKREVATYASSEECLEQVGFYLAHAEQRESIARAGQERTLREHNYRVRMEELVSILGRHLGAGRSSG